jgi:hypothetical protein
MSHLTGPALISLSHALRSGLMRGGAFASFPLLYYMPYYSKACCLFATVENASIALCFQMPPYCFHDCHYFYRTALRLLSLHPVF